MSSHSPGGKEEVLTIHYISDEVEKILASLHNDAFQVLTPHCSVVAVPVASDLPHFRVLDSQFCKDLLKQLIEAKLLSQGRSQDGSLNIEDSCLRGCWRELFEIVVSV